MKLALAQIDMRLGDIEGICGRIEDQARLAHERGARVLCVPAPLFMGALPGGLVGATDFEHDMLTGLTGVAERIQELDMICIVPAAVSFEGQPLLDYMMLKDGHVVPARSSIALQRGGNGDARWAPPVFDVDGVRIAVIFDLDRDLEMLPTGVDLIAYFQFNAFDMTDRETAAIAAVRNAPTARSRPSAAYGLPAWRRSAPMTSRCIPAGRLYSTTAGAWWPKRRVLKRACWFRRFSAA